jgi:hypothetical protein
MLKEGLDIGKSCFPNEESTVLEFGVYHGTSYLMLTDHIIENYPGTKLIGFDSWKGIPAETEGVWYPDRHNAGAYKSPKSSVLNGLMFKGLAFNERFQLVDGYFENSLTPSLQASIKNLVFVNVDVDIHKSTVELLEFIYPLLRVGVVLYFDDWKDPNDLYDGKWGEHLAWEEFIDKYPHIKYATLKVNENNQRLIQITEC